MIPAVDIQTSDSYRLDLPEPLSMEDQLLVDVLTRRYEGIEMPFMTFSRDGWTTICYPKTIRGKIPELGANPNNAKSLADKAQEVLRISGGENGGN